MHHDEGAASQSPNGSEHELEIDFYYTPSEFEKASTFAEVPDDNLPFEVLLEHQRKNMDNTCDPNRKWRYFYLDGLFSSASHHIIKSNDSDEFNMESIGQIAYIYAHGDTRTYKRLRANIATGKPIVMLHNSGGCVTAFSWLQRVMAFSRPPPDAREMRGPLRFLIANLSRANWTQDFGVPEMMMMKTLAERAPQLFRKNVVSVDILTESEEQTLEVITGCFAAQGGVPELGLGNAEVNVIFNAWNMHLLLSKNAKSFHKASLIAQLIIWALMLVTTFVSIFASSMYVGKIKTWFFESVDATTTDAVREQLNLVVFILPILSALVTTVTSKLLWRDKWSVCLMAASQLVCEIYKFRMTTLEYNPKPKPAGPGDEEQPPMSQKEKARLARLTFVTRINAMYGACLTELSQGSALRKKRTKVSIANQYEYRSSQEAKPSISQWVKLKVHLEHTYYRSAWRLPEGAFISWMAGLRPYLNQRSIREELRSVLEQLCTDKRIAIVGKPLSDSDSNVVRHALEKSLGLRRGMLEKQKAEIRQMQRLLVVDLFKEQMDMANEEAKENKRMGMGGSLGMAGARSLAGGYSMMGSEKVHPKDDDEEKFFDAPEAMRKKIMEMQGLKYGKLTAQQKADEKKARKKKASETKIVEDDYLCGPFSIDSYVVYRVRPMIERLEKQVMRLSLRLQICEFLGFTFNAVGAIFAVDAVALTEWISLTVAIVAVLTGIIEFTQLRNQVVSVNLALKEMQAIIVKWDALSLVRRRTPGIKAEIVKTTEYAFLSIVDNHTTAAANTQTNVEKKLNGEDSEDEDGGEAAK